MDQTTKHNLNRQLRQPVYAIWAAALVMLLCVFLPYGTATGERRDWIDAHPDSIIEESLGLTAQDLAQVSTVEYTRLYVTVADEWGFTTAYLGFYVALLGLLLLFPLLTALCALLRKPIGAMLFTALTFGVSCIQNADYTMRGILPSDNYSWGIAHILWPIAAAAAFAGSVWLLVKKKRCKRAIPQPAALQESQLQDETQAQ